ncbi:RNA-dependent RNA polymerase [Thelebolus microsporus totivirus 1]|nr:RNA-dependent RNA polymerase [Thelebolus microsporus totivirus 1]
MSFDARATERAATFGALGRYLVSELASSSIPLDLFFDKSISAQVVLLAQYISRAPASGSIPVCAASLLLSDFPVQAYLSTNKIRQLALNAFDPLPCPLDPSAALLTGFSVMSNSALREAYFPRKSHPGASTKVNIFLSEVLHELQFQGSLAIYDKTLRAIAGRVTDDQATACLLYIAGLRSQLGPAAFEVGAAMVLQPANAKGLSTALKALGANSDRLGAALTEGNVLQGRAVGSIDLRAAAAERCDPEWVAAHVVDPDLPGLRTAVRSIISEELEGRFIEFDPLEHFWHRRWQWCVNGSHSRAINGRMGIDTVTSLPGIDRVYRRMVAETCTEEPISGWDGTTLVSASEKLEHGKTRAIFACDTRSYFAFEHLLGPVSAAWQHKKVILDPGRFGHLGMAQRVLKARRRGGLNLMIDYDDFNSHHATRTMQMVFEELCSIVGYPTELSRPIISSFDKCHLRAYGKDVGHVVGTLMSGHRGTSFINSVLNAAYVRAAVGEPFYRTLEALHVGDDVYMSPATHSDAGLILASCAAAGCRMNPSKQSVGNVGAEFLRLAIRPTHAVGYLARSIASAVSGNWVNESRLSTVEATQSAVVTCRSLMNRSGFTGYPALLARSLNRASRIPLRLCRRLLEGSVSQVGAPIYSVEGVMRNVMITPDPLERQADRLNPAWPSSATGDYLSYAAAAPEILVLAQTDCPVKPAMLLSSYRKAVAGDLMVSPSAPRVARLPDKVPVGSASVFDLLQKPAKEGVLVRYPLLPLVRRYIPRPLLMELITLAGGDINARNLDIEAWGATATSKVIQGVMSYSDAASLSARTLSGTIYSTYPVYM